MSPILDNPSNDVVEREAEAIADGILDASVNYDYSLEDAVEAHVAIESGATLGASLLVP